jgi:hypothetical protein
MSEEEWYKKNNCEHAHCPDNCEHPQPFMRNSKLLCGRCWFKFNEEVEMIPCDQDIC